MLLPAMIVAGPVLTMLRSADVSTVVLAVELLLVLSVSVVVVVTLATLVMIEPLASLLMTCSTTTKVAVTPHANKAMVSLMLPPELVSGNAGPGGCVFGPNGTP